MSCARKRSMKDVLTPVEATLKICRRGSAPRRSPRRSKRRTFDTLPNTFRMLARMMLPIRMRPMSLDHVATSMSMSSSTASRPRSEVSKSVPEGLSSGEAGSASSPSTGRTWWCLCEYPNTRLTHDCANSVSSRLPSSHGDSPEKPCKRSTRSTPNPPPATTDP